MASLVQNLDSAVKLINPSELVVVPSLKPAGKTSEPIWLLPGPELHKSVLLYKLAFVVPAEIMPFQSANDGEQWIF